MASTRFPCITPARQTCLVASTMVAALPSCTPQSDVLRQSLLVSTRLTTYHRRLNMLKKEASLIVGGWSKPSKMPCKSYSIPAEACKTGSKLRQQPGTVCSDCYACKGMYRFPVVQKALYRRLASLVDPSWVEAMVTIIGDDKHFRWHDSGDVQSVEHLRLIVAVSIMTPNCKHWLPTKEASLVGQYRKTFGVPENLVIRISAPMIDGKIPSGLSSRSVTKPTEGQHTCPAPTQNGSCGSCRACWDTNVDNVDYLMH